jgi:hypothetical protein
MAKEKDAADRKEEYDGTKLGVDMAKTKEEHNIQMMQTLANAQKKVTND